MIRGIEQRLRKLEAANDGPQRLRIVFSATSDEPDWDSQIAEVISSGRASADDEFMRVGWIPSSACPLSSEEPGPSGMGNRLANSSADLSAGP
jgi:hypothetical protein